MKQKVKKSVPLSGLNFLGLSFQVGIFIFLGTWGGIKLDKLVGTKPLFAILFAMLTIAFSMYYIIRKTNNKKK